MTEGIIHGSRYITYLRPITESVSASGLYPSPILFLRADTGKINKIESYSSMSGDGSHFTILTPKLSACYGRSEHEGFYIGDVQPNGFPFYSWHGDASLSFKVPLDFFSLEAIEQNRKSDLVITIYGDVTIAAMEEIQSQNSFLGKITGYTRGELSLSFKIPQSTWVNNVLGRIGHRKFHLLEIDLSRHCQIHEALEYVNKMETSLHSHGYENVAVLSRELVDFLTEDFLAKKNLNNCERWKRSASRLKHLASLFVHKEKIGREVGEDINIHRSDAEYLLLQSQAIIRYAQEIAVSG